MTTIQDLIDGEDSIFFDTLLAQRKSIIDICSDLIKKMEKDKHIATNHPSGICYWSAQDERELKYIKHQRYFYLSELKLYRKIARRYRKELGFIRRFCDKN